MVYESSYLANLNLFFECKFRFRIALSQEVRQVLPLINGHGFKLKYFLFTYFHSMLIESTSVKWEVRVWNLGQIFKTQLNHCAVILCSTLSLQSIFSLHSFFAQTLEHVIRPQKNEKWGLEIQDRSSRSDYRWLVSNTVPLSLPKIYKLFEPFWLLN